MYSLRSRPYAPAASAAGVLPYLRRVYALFGGGIAFAIVGALVALYAGEPAVLSTRGGAVTVPPLVAFGLEHGIVSFIVYLGAFFAASALRRRPGVNVAALFGFTFVSGLFLAPAIFIAQALASQGVTLSAAPVRDAFLLTGAAFAGLTTYAFVTKRDFSFLRAALSMGLWVVIGASLLALLFQSPVLHLAVASVSVLLFGGFILYDTQRILRTGEAEQDAVGAALGLFLDVINLFVSLLRILSASTRRD